MIPSIYSDAAGHLLGGNWAGLAGDVKKYLLDTEVGNLQTAELVLTNETTEEELQLAPPESVDIQTAANFRTYSIVELGERAFPKGNKLLRVRWSGYLFDAGILFQNILPDASIWDEPRLIAEDLERWQSNGDKVHCLITNTPVNFTFFIKSFHCEPWRMGHYKYDLELSLAAELNVRTVEEEDNLRAQEQELNSRPRQKSRLGKRLNNVDNIYNIVRILTGNGSLRDVEKLLDKNNLSLDTLEPGLIIWG